MSATKHRIACARMRSGGWHTTFDGGKTWEDGVFDVPPEFAKADTKIEIEIRGKRFAPLGLQFVLQRERQLPGEGGQRIQHPCGFQRGTTAQTRMDARA